MTNQKGVVHLFLLLIILLIVGGSVYALVHFKIIKLPNFFGNAGKGSVTTKVELKSEYKNPFDKGTQYVNPFDQYKNPFVVAK